ncbi:unnamed protein product [Ambrosiozyma monospora]|uniref:Unnamed protein product n=1 Tax=Ambrosiozyma monospora TaxID=43982 RepID=A0ACB5TB12_AMBMO|nr:unnamed protein product [Ambrosiozyma monospora]
MPLKEGKTTVSLHLFQANHKHHHILPIKMQSITLESIIPFLDGENIFNVDFTSLLSILSKESVIQNASKNELNHLCSRVNNYLKSNNTNYRWLGSKLFIVLNLHPEILMSSHTINFINALIKIIESKCFIRDLSRPPYQEVVTLRSAVYALDFIIEKIKGKPALTREVLTPKLPQIITVLLDLVPLIPEKVIPLLHKLLINNSTTFRPFGTKFEKQLLNLLHDDQNFEKFDAELMSCILKSLVLLSFSLTRTNANEVWRQKVVQLILEIKSVVTIYSHFLNTEDDQDLTSYLEMLPKLPENPDDLKTIFKPLSIDVNDTPFDFLKINRRIRVLTSLLAEYIQTSTTLTVKKPEVTLLQSVKHLLVLT